MTRTQLVKQLADFSTRPLLEFHQPAAETAADPVASSACSDLFVWFEDTSARARNGRTGIAGLPEALLPWPQEPGQMRVVERRYVEGHLHLLSAVRIRCAEKFGERIAALYTAALSVGTVAWIGTGGQYERAWMEMYPYGAQADGPVVPDTPGRR